MGVLVDSDIIIEVTRGRNLELLSKWIDLSSSNIAILYSPVSEAELWAGACPNEHDALNEFLRSLICTPITREIGRQAGDYLRQYKKSHGVEVPDALIAASAVASGPELWTRNRKHFPMKDVLFYETVPN